MLCPHYGINKGVFVYINNWSGSFDWKIVGGDGAIVTVIKQSYTHKLINIQLSIFNNKIPKASILVEQM